MSTASGSECKVPVSLREQQSGARAPFKSVVANARALGLVRRRYTTLREIRGEGELACNDALNFWNFLGQEAL